MEKRILIKAGQWELDAAIHKPKAPPTWGVVVCHPHPQYGGDMNNNVVMGLVEALAGSGMATLRYNMRGVGGSTGRLAGPDGDADDLLNVIAYLSREDGFGDKIAIVGYSYGSVVALKTAEKSNKIEALGVVAPPVAMFDMSGLISISIPHLIVCGDSDAFCPIAKLEKSLNLRILPGVDHFFAGDEIEAGEIVADFLKNLSY